ncbi:AP-2 complex subunit alpha-1-like [Camellia sinensis]|uniref:AP-2 complex subunit alpha-1-like n=1 Tax=Camellia sinensis TaxID=4442 RepID=UPI0010366CE3|nr:AP-2 complex subunit alpha-1-like [Camellia sinensis]
MRAVRYVDVILQLIDKAGDFVSDDIWFRVVQFVTNNEDLQLYVAVKAMEYLDKPTVHETMVKVSAYILGEYSHLLARWPGTSTISILLSTYAKILMHNQPPDPELQNQIWAIFHKYESCIDVEIQQRAVEYFALSRKGADLVDILAEMPKFPERQSALIRKAEDTKADTAEQSATKLRSLHQTSNALVVTDQRPANGMPPVNQLGLVKVPNMSNVDHNSVDQGVTEANETDCGGSTIA